jgi:hypothetical protein
MSIARYLRQADLFGFGIAVIASLALFGCGGGGSSPATDQKVESKTITGTAAAGAPVVGYVSVRDSSANPQPVRTNIPIAANGNYSVDVTGLTAPFAFLARGSVGGKTVELYSAATVADVGGKINITPFTDLMIRNIAATAVDTYLNNSANMANFTAAALDAQRVALTEKLAPALSAMGLSGSIDLLRATFNADNAGLDRFMDVVKVDTSDPAAVTITNILDAANTLVIDTTNHGTSTGDLGTANLTGATPVDGMVQTVNAFSALFATSLPSPANPSLLALVSASFMDGGETRDVFLTNITSQPSLIGMRFTNLVVDSVDTAAGIAQIHFTVIVGGSASHETIGGANPGQMKRDANGVWQLNGDRRIAYVGIKTDASKNTCNPANTACSMSVNYSTGLNLNIDNRAALAIGSAVVTGPGLPGGGVTLVAQANKTWLEISTPNPFCAGCTGNMWWMDDAAIAVVPDNSVYTVKLYDNAATPALLATYTEVLPVAPTLNTDLATLAYPSLTGMVDLAGMGEATLTPSWSLPTGLFGAYLGVNVSQTSSGQNREVWINNMATSTGTASLAITPPSTGTWSGGMYYIAVWNQNAGKVSANYQ